MVQQPESDGALRSNQSNIRVSSGTLPDGTQLVRFQDRASDYELMMDLAGTLRLIGLLTNAALNLIVNAAPATPKPTIYVPVPGLRVS